jgi:hypothetical protein
LNETSLQFANHSNDLTNFWTSFITNLYESITCIIHRWINATTLQPSLSSFCIKTNFFLAFQSLVVTLCTNRVLTLKNSTFSPHFAVTTRHPAFTGFYNRGAVCSLGGTDCFYI